MQREEAQSTSSRNNGDILPDTSRPPPQPLLSNGDGPKNQQSDTAKLLTVIVNNQRHQQSQLTFLSERISSSVTSHFNETRMIQRMDEFTTLAQNLLAYNLSGRCGYCGFYIGHTSTYMKHKTCICKLMTQKTICCLDGYAAIMEAIPCLGILSPVPLACIYELDSVSAQGSEPVISRSAEAHQHFISTCNEVRRKIVTEHIDPSPNFSISIED